MTGKGNKRKGEGGGAADLRIVTVVTMIAAANEVRGWNADWRKTLPGTDEGDAGSGAILIRKFGTFVLVCVPPRDLFSRVIKRALMNGRVFNDRRAARVSA